MKGNVLRKRNSIRPLSGKSWKKGEKERLPTTNKGWLSGLVWPPLSEGAHPPKMAAGKTGARTRFGGCIIPKRKVVYFKSRWSDQAALLAPTYIQWHRVMRQYEHGTPYSNPETEGLGLTANTHLYA
ncbi:hypothetical protein KY290_000739 [Solanum tuberosum]|uniref:Uncharacterized protein n=1 Tax=Solanum tuberosum TaxID=4113 RepID=A0ABQ7WLK5_SOLTU|nr:hypothetical protein KY289_004126 [Solanum tuberosum]KAH0781141.1 hypothetical protein KY290_000739 [Solanum tuberosum]